MIREKWLSDVMFTTVESKANISRVKKAANGDFQIGDLSRAVNNAQSNEITVRSWLSRCSERKSTLVFCVDIAHLKSLTHEFRKYSVDARFITGETPMATRQERLAGFKRGEFPVLLNCGIFTEGTDIPNIDCVLLARPTRSRNLLVQMIGRGMRLHSGKANCHVIDMVASLETGIVTTPTLFGLDPSCLIKEANIDDIQRLQSELEQQDLGTASSEAVTNSSPSGDPSQTLTFTQYDTIWDLISDTSSERYIRGMSPLAWVQVDEDRYILSSNIGDYLTIERNTSEAQPFQVFHTRRLSPVQLDQYKESNRKRLSRSPYARPYRIATAPTLSAAVLAADTFAKERFTWIMISHSQSWRSRPASEGQLSFLNAFREQDNKLTAETLTKGKAGDMITKTKFGARARFRKIEQQRQDSNRRALKQQKDMRIRKREVVMVGPLGNNDRDSDEHSDTMPTDFDGDLDGSDDFFNFF